jgi:hypothetical protein
MVQVNAQRTLAVRPFHLVDNAAALQIPAQSHPRCSDSPLTVHCFQCSPSIISENQEFPHGEVRFPWGNHY